MNKYIALQLDHPFLNDLKQSNPVSYVSTQYYQIFQPSTEQWPLYAIRIRPTDSGISLELTIKRGMSNFWQPITMFEPLPFELVPVLANMLLSLSTVVVDRSHFGAILNL